MNEMLIWGMALIGAAFLLFILEVFVPSGGVISLTGIVVAIAGIVCLFMYKTTWGFAGLGVVVVLGPLTSYFMFTQVLPNTPMGRQLFLTDQQKPESIERSDREASSRLVGLVGVAETDLRPVGRVRVGDDKLEAMSEVAMIEAGAEIRITSVEGNTIRVRPA